MAGSVMQVTLKQALGFTLNIQLQLSFAVLQYCY